MCNQICNKGWWEISSVQDYFEDFFTIKGSGLRVVRSMERALGSSRMPVLLDIGAHIGFYSMVFAAHGWKSIAVEMMPNNLQMIRASLCRNPHLRERVQLLPVALQSVDPKPGQDMCRIVSLDFNIGTSKVCCGDDYPNNCRIPKHMDMSRLHVRGIVPIRTLNSVLQSLEPGTSSIDVVKMDVEGYECEVLRGGSQLFNSSKPFFLKVELMEEMYKCTAKEFLQFMQDRDYTLKDYDRDRTLNAWFQLQSSSASLGI